MEKEKKTKSKKKGFFSKINPKTAIKGLWIAFGGFVIVIAIIFTLINWGVIGYIPPIEDLENPIDKYASQVYSSDGVQLGTYSLEKNNRIYSDFEDLPKFLVDGLVATEDVRYYSHSGIDLRGLGRATVKTLTGQKTSGGSTISQQLVKQLYSPKAKSLVERLLQKPIEWVIAVKLERYYTKDEIINLYLNKYDFGYNAVGIQSAAQVYFNKPASELKKEEAAVLVGMCNNSSLYNPIRRPELTKQRRNIVFGQMLKYGYITQQEFDSLKLLPLTLDFKRASHVSGLAPYLREYLRIIMSAKKPVKSNYADWQMEQFSSDSLNWETNPLFGWCNKNKKADGSPYNLATDGLKIFTTIDSRMQEYAEQAMTEHLSKDLQPKFEKEKKGRAYSPYAYSERNKVDEKLTRAMKNSDRYKAMKKAGISEREIEKAFKQPIEMKVFSWRGETDTIMTPLDSIRYHKSFLRSGFMAMDTHNGFVKAYVGGIDYGFFKYDMVNMARRQVGSTIKPYLYTLAMEEGMTPCDEMVYAQQTLIAENGKEWSPRGLKASKVGETVSIRWGLQNSDNMVTAYLMSRTSPYTFARMLHSFGLTGHIDPVISMSLGTPEVTVAEMAAAYTSFANKGVRVSPIYVTHIEDQHGNIIDNFTPKLHEVFSEASYVKMIDMLQGVVSGGTGSRIRRYGITAPMGGKTGTTNSNSDGWFMGFTPSLSAACWVGGEEPTIHFDSMANGQGASAALPIVGLFYKKVFEDKSLGYSQTERFPVVKGYGVCDKSQDVDETPETTVGIDNMFN